MYRPSSNRKTADVLRKTIKDLESDPAIDPEDPAFVNLKCTLLERILKLESDKAHAESVIHLVDAAEPVMDQDRQRGEEEDDSAIA